MRVLVVTLLTFKKVKLIFGHPGLQCSANLLSSTVSLKKSKGVLHLLPQN